MRCFSVERIPLVKSLLGSAQPPTDIQEHRVRWRARLQLQDDALLVVGVGRLTAQKNFGRFIEAVVLANQQQPVYAVIAGPDMGLGDTPQQQIQAAGLDPAAIRLIGPVEDALELICAADIFLLSSDYEGMPNVVLEAMVVGILCVCTQVNGIDTLIEPGVHGFITTHSPEALAKPMLWLAADPILRNQIGQNARMRIEVEFDPALAFQKLLQFCEHGYE